MSISWASNLNVLRCVGLVAAAFFSPARSFAVDDPIFHTGTCALKNGVEAEGDTLRALFEVCVNGRVGGQLSTVSGNSKENFATSYAQGSLGIHFSEYMSLFGEASSRRRFPFDDETPELIERNSQLMAARLGNAMIHGFSLTSGKFRAPFGIGINEGSQSHKYFSDDFHWKTYDYGHWLTWDNLKNAFVDVSYVGETISGKRIETEKGEPPREADWGGSVRVGYDFSAIEGSRLVGSVYAQKNGLRRSGLGFISVNNRGDTNWIEFVRTRSTPDGQLDPFRQIIKFGYLSVWRSGRRWTVSIEEDRNTQRLGEVTHHFSFLDYGELNFGVLMRRTLTSPYQDRWHITSGIEVKL